MPIASFFRPVAFPLRQFFAVLLAAASTALAQSPSASDGYDPNVDGNVYAVAAQPDGKLILAGQFGAVRPNGSVGSTRGNLARINADGSLDLAFDPSADGPVRALVLQADGKILIGGDFTSLKPNGAATAIIRNRIARLNADGTLDTTFNPNVGGGLISQVNALLLQPDGRVVLGGNFTTVGGATRNRLARVNADGSLDAGYDPNADNVVFALAQHVDGKILVAGGFTTFKANGATSATLRNRIARLNPNGTPDSEFDPNFDNRATALAVQRDGKILVGGDFISTQPNGGGSYTKSHFLRLNVDGSLDTTFTSGVSGNVAGIAVRPDGSILVGGSFTTVWSGSVAPVGRSYVARFLSDGTADLNFSAGANSNVMAFAQQPDGKIVLAGYFTGLQPRGAFFSTVRNRVARISDNGSLDATFDLDFGGRPLVEAVQRDGKLLIGGSFSSVGGQTHRALARLNADGTVDTAFVPEFNGLVLAIAVQPADQKILVGGTFTTIGGETRNYIARLNPSGTIDSEFNPNAGGQVGSIVLQSDGKILIGGAFTSLQPIGSTTSKTRTFVARLNADGTLDAAFHPNANGPVHTIALQSDGKVLIGGAFSAVTPDVDLTPTVTTNKDGTTTSTVATNGTTTTRSSIARLSADGTLDKIFDPNTNGAVNALAVQSDGKIVIGGSFSALRPNDSTTTATRNRIARLNADGTLDTAFDPNFNNTVLAVAVQSDGKILVGGPFTSAMPNGAKDYTFRNYAARLNADGTVDATFNLDLNQLGGNRVDSWLVLADGRILVGGNFVSLQPVGATTRVAQSRLALLKANGTLDATFTPGVGGAVGAQINAIALQPDGKMVVAGAFAGLGGTSTANLARFNAEGTADSGFAPAPGADGPINSVLVRPDSAAVVSQGTGFAWLNANGSVRTAFAPVVTSRINGYVSAVAVQPDGSVIVGGTFTVTAGTPGPNLMRFNANGVLDANFGPSPNGPVEAIVVQPDGKIVIAGGFTSVAGTTRNYVARLNANGTLDTNFNPNPSARTSALALQGDGKIILGGTFVSLNPNGSTSTTTTSAATTASVKDGTTTTTSGNTTTTTVIATVSGTTTTTVTVVVGTAVTRNYLARVNADGTLDVNFNPNPNGAVNALLLQADGKLVLGGAFGTLQPGTTNGTTITLATTATVRNRIARLNADGTIETAYDPNLNDTVYALALFTDGKVIAGGSFTSLQPNFINGANRNRLVRLNPDGTTDSNFNPNIVDAAVVTSIVVQSDSKVVIGGTFTSLQPNGATSATARNRLARLNFDGSLDTGYNPDANGPVSALALASDGTLVVGGTFTTVSPNSSLLIGGAFSSIGGVSVRNLALVGDDGSTNSNFLANPNGAVNTLLAQPDGKFLVGGAFTSIGGAARSGLARFNSDNSLDATFVPALTGTVRSVALQPDGKILVVTSQLLRLNADGSRDAAYAPTFPIVVTGGVTPVSVAVQADGRALLLARSATTSYLQRYNADGSTAETIGQFAGQINTFSIGTDGRVTIGGSGASSATRLARITSTGATDSSFDPGANGPVTALALQTDGRLVIGGSFSTVGGLPRSGLARLAATSIASQSLAATRTSVVLARGGGGPEFSGVAFEQSSDRQTWTKLGNAGRVSGTANWQLNGLSLPASGLFYLRGRSIVPTGAGTSSGTLEIVREFNLAAAAGVGPSSNSVATLDIGGLLTDSATGLISGQSAPSSAPAMSDAPIGVVAQSTFSLDGSTGTARLSNFSARARVNAGGVLITGFAVSGTAPRTLLLRAAGPSLAAFGVSGVLATPRLQLFNSAGQVIRENNGWAATTLNLNEVGAAMVRTGAFPFAANSGADAALVATLLPGTYSIQVSDPNGKGGVTLAEIYDAGDDATDSRLVNLSIRGDVNLGEGSLISGFVLAGNATRRLLVRGDGPALAQYGVAGVLADPMVGVYGASGQLLASNDNWSATSAGPAMVTAALSVGAFPLVAGSKDAAVSLTVAPGLYTVQLTGSNASTGAALIEIYELP